MLFSVISLLILTNGPSNSSPELITENRLELISAIETVTPTKKTLYDKHWFDIDGDRNEDLLYCYFTEAESRAQFTGIQCVVALSKNNRMPGFVKLELPLSEELTCLDWQASTLTVYSFYRHVTRVLTFDWNHELAQQSSWGAVNSVTVDERYAEETVLDKIYDCSF
ncbi:hypothetical protein [Planctobacterium marinum]|uniref:Uncharacterized protein n=1 Tax=Planctobacterium marinum TaxID=1631968 RepID=A0AA48HJE9_9ALTE|nr:hypothetical protein MACH26_18900 [Planctobacterium marinum]